MKRSIKLLVFVLLTLGFIGSYVPIKAEESKNVVDYSTNQEEVVVDNTQQEFTMMYRPVYSIQEEVGYIPIYFVERLNNTVYSKKKTISALKFLNYRYKEFYYTNKINK